LVILFRFLFEVVDVTVGWLVLLQFRVSCRDGQIEQQYFSFAAIPSKIVVIAFRKNFLLDQLTPYGCGAFIGQGAIQTLRNRAGI
jgi:hypothetical protein